MTRAVPTPPARWRLRPGSGCGGSFFIKGRFRFAQKFNNPAKAAAAWKEIEPA